jgi:hypothetical protein
MLHLHGKKRLIDQGRKLWLDESKAGGYAIYRRPPQAKIDIGEPRWPKISGCGGHGLGHVIDDLAHCGNGFDALEKDNWPSKRWRLRLEMLPNDVGAG